MAQEHVANTAAGSCTCSPVDASADRLVLVGWVTATAGFFLLKAALCFLLVGYCYRRRRHAWYACVATDVTQPTQAFEAGIKRPPSEPYIPPLAICGRSNMAVS